MFIPSGSEGRQMTNRESEQRIVPLTPGNAGRGKALSPTRDPNDTPAVRSDGQESLVNPAVHDRLSYIHERAQAQPTADFSRFQETLLSIPIKDRKIKLPTL